MQTIEIIRKEFLLGKWKGWYKYGKEYPKKYHRLTEVCEVEITHYDDTFKGICHDNYTKKLFRSPASIEGGFEGDRIYFIKRYPGLLTFDEEDNPAVFSNKPSIAIQYEGFLYRSFWKKEYYMKGGWSIDISFLDKDNNAVYQSDTGAWKLVKVK